MKKMLREDRLKKTIQIIGFIILVLALALMVPRAEAAFPEKPIKIIVYTGPGGLIDITARKFAGVASNYTDANFVVENKPGAGGIVALKKVVQAPADGYNLYACTKSNIAKFVQVGGQDYLDALTWAAMLMADPECVITNGTQEIHTWEDVVANALSNPGEQNWVGPAAGGLDHVTALKIWDKYGMDAKWIPFKSGGKALAALLGEQGVAYVGNPRDALGNADLHIAAISSAQRLPAFPDAPTFAELGMEGLAEEIMWRGFALKKGAPKEVLAWYHELFTQVTADEEWRRFWGKGGIDVTYLGVDEFTPMVYEDAKIFEYYLRKSDILPSDNVGFAAQFASGTKFMVLSLMLVIAWLSGGYAVYCSRYKLLTGRILMIGFFFLVSILFLIQTLNFPSTSAVGPAAVPRLWIAFLIPLNLLLLVRTFMQNEVSAQSGPRSDIVFTFVGLLVAYLIIMQFIGYFLSTFAFILVALYYLGYRNKRVGLIIASCWIIFSYIVFYKTLYLPLPLGRLFESIF